MVRRAISRLRAPPIAARAEPEAPKLPPRREEAEGSVPGLVRITQPSGKQSWAVRYRIAGRSVKFTLGSAKAIPVKVARKLAMAALVKVAEGKDPHAEKVAARRAAKAPVKVVTFERLMENFLAASAKKNRARTTHDYRRLLKKDVLPRWKGRDITDITKKDVISLLDDMVERGAGVSANRAFQCLRTAMAWAEGRDLIAVNPTRGVRPPVLEQSRDRVLSDGELSTLWRHLEAVPYPVGPIIRLLMLTGARRSEIEGMHWGEIDFDARTWLLPAERSKSRRERLTPLPDAAMNIIENLPRIGHSDFVFTVDEKHAFSAMQAAKRDLDKTLGFEAWVLHDLRRSVATGLQKLEIEPHVISACLGHTIVSGVGARYSRFDYFPQKRVALDKWAEFLADNARNHLKAVG